MRSMGVTDAVLIYLASSCSTVNLRVIDRRHAGLTCHSPVQRAAQRLRLVHRRRIISCCTVHISEE